MANEMPTEKLTLGRYTIIDEADEMVSPDWVDDMREIMGGGN